MDKVILKNGKELVLSKAKKEDAEEVISFLNLVGGESDNLLFGRGEFNNDVKKEETYIESLSKQPTSIMQIGRIDGEIASIASISSSPRKRISHTCEMALTVRKKYWNIGVGTASMASVIEWARQTGVISIIHLGVRRGNDVAYNMYKKFGFEEMGVYKNFFYVDGEYYDSILMNLYL